MTSFVTQSPASIQVHIVRAFTRDGVGGNPAGVVLDSSGLTAADRQVIAAELNLSETAFLERNSGGGYHLEFFTPTRPIANCGHATIATFALLRAKGLEKNSVAAVSIAGNAVQIFFDGDLVFMEQRGPVYEALESPTKLKVIESLGLSSNGLNNVFSPQIVDTGNRFLLVGLASKRELASIRPDFDLIQEFSEVHQTIGYYVFVPTEGDFSATTRMFAPRFGIKEESATGMAAGPLAAALIEKLDYPARNLRVLQGEFMSPPCPSELLIRPQMNGTTLSRLLVGGRATAVEERTIQIHRL